MSNCRESRRDKEWYRAWGGGLVLVLPGDRRESRRDKEWCGVGRGPCACPPWGSRMRRGQAQGPLPSSPQPLVPTRFIMLYVVGSVSLTSSSCVSGPMAATARG